MAQTGGDAVTETKPVTDPLVAEIQTRVKDAFGIFDHERNGTIDVRSAAVFITAR